MIFSTDEQDPITKFSAGVASTNDRTVLSNIVDTIITKEDWEGLPDACDLLMSHSIDLGAQGVTEAPANVVQGGPKVTGKGLGIS